MPALQEKHGYKNVHQVPKVIESCRQHLASAPGSDVKQALEDAKAELAMITGQKPAETRRRRASRTSSCARIRPSARRSPCAAAMYEFLERLIKTALPRIRDFRGVSTKAFDGNGNYTLGVSDQSIFPEVELDKIKRNIGFDVTIVTTARTNEEAKSLLSELGMPFTDKAKKAAAENRRAARGGRQRRPPNCVPKEMTDPIADLLTRVRNAARRAQDRNSPCLIRRSRARSPAS